MKLRFLVLFALLWIGLPYAYASSYSQAMRVSISVENLSVEETFRELEQKTGFGFLYKNEILTGKQKVRIDAKDELLTDVLNDLLTPLGLIYTIDDNVIVVNSKQETLKVAQQAGSSVTITGVVSDESGESLPGVTISLKTDRTKGTTSDFKGAFKMDNLKVGDILVFSYIGMEPSEVLIKRGTTVYNIVLKSSSLILGEVVVETGMFQRDKATYSGSTASYSSDELKAVGNQNILQSLKTLDPSFVVFDNMDMGSNPNSTPSIVIRGGGSSTLNAIKDEFSADPNMPLFVVNGVETSITKVMDLDMNRVASTHILKDAGSTAIYGSRGANGVVVIELIKPKPGELNISYTGNLSASMPDLGVYNMMNAAEKLEFERLSGKYISSRGGYPEYQKILDNLYNFRLAEIARGVDTYWLSEPIRTGISHSHSVRVNGGNEELSIDVGAKYGNTAGVMKGSNRESWSGDIALTYRVANFIINNQLDVSGYGSNESHYGSFSTWVDTTPYFRKRSADGQILPYLEYKLGESSYQGLSSVENDIPNPLYNAMLDSRNKESSLSVSNNLSLQYEPGMGLRFKAGLILDRTIDKIDQFTPPEHTKFSKLSLYQKGTSYNKTTEFLSYKGYIDGSLSKTIKDHSLTVFLRGELLQDKAESNAFAAQGFPMGSKGTPNLAYSYKENSKPEYNLLDRRGVSFISTLNYHYAKRYSFDATYRLDGATTFGSNELYKSFWSLTFGWNIAEELFAKKLEWLDILKLRGSIGTNGNQNQGRTFSENIYQLSLYSNVFNQGMYLGVLANPNLPWSVRTKKGVGLDFRAKGGKFSLVLDYYHEKTDPNILEVIQAPSIGVSAYPMQLGTLLNKGIEFRATYSPIYNIKDRVIWQINITGLNNKSEYGNFGSAAESLNAQQLKSKTMARYMDGESPNAIWAIRSAGIDPATGKEVFIKKNGELTMEYSADDIVVVGNTSPDIQGVISTSFRYKNFSAQVAMRYSLGGDIYNTALFNKVENIGLSALGKNQDKRALYDRWKEPGDISKFKAISHMGSASTTYASSRFVQKNNYLKGESISVSYELYNNRWLRENFGVKLVKLSGYLNDIFWLETSKTERGYSYPFARNISFGINLSF